VLKTGTELLLPTVMTGGVLFCRDSDRCMSVNITRPVCVLASSGVSNVKSTTEFGPPASYGVEASTPALYAEYAKRAVGGMTYFTS